MKYTARVTIHHRRMRKPGQREAEYLAIPTTVIAAGEEFDSAAIGLDDEDEIARLLARGFIRPVAE